MWETWKRGFDVWERTTADYFEKVLKNSIVLRPTGALLSATLKTKAKADRATARWWSFVGLPTKQDQERGLHKLNQLESRIFDLEDRLEASVRRATVTSATRPEG